jgi:hypothetical protein
VLWPRAVAYSGDAANGSVRHDDSVELPLPGLYRQLEKYSLAFSKRGGLQLWAPVSSAIGWMAWSDHGETPIAPSRGLGRAAPLPLLRVGDVGSIGLEIEIFL